MKLFGIIAALTVLLGCVHDTPAQAVAPLTVDSKRLIKVIGPINGDILKQANQLSSLALKNKKPIYIMLNSPGGMVFSGDLFIAAIQQAQSNGINIVCFSTVYAASMAFNILLHCDERYTFANTLLLFHPIRISSQQPLTAPLLQQYADELQEYDIELLRLLKKKLKMKSAVIAKHYYAETFWRAKKLSEASRGFFTIVKDIRGVKNLFQFQKKRRNMFGKAPSEDELRKRINTNQLIPPLGATITVTLLTAGGKVVRVSENVVAGDPNMLLPALMARILSRFPVDTTKVLTVTIDLIYTTKGEQVYE